MALYRSPQFGVEPYQESQGAQEAPSQGELQAFYEIQRRESQQKRLAKRKSGGPTALWARKSLKRSPTAPSTPTHVTGSSPPSQPTPSPQNFRSLSQDTARHAQHFDIEKLEDQKENLNDFSQMNHSASVVPDSDPAWYNKDIWASVPHPVYKASYRLHNPVGPRWYRNYHLIPASQLRSAARPPSVFSPFFPPMGTTSMPERSLDSRMAGPSRTPSGSPLPTPSSSQTRVADATQKPRSRKPSLTTPDGIELDITDPWGATWHNPSPYDFGISPTSTLGTSATENIASSRPRRASMTGFQIKRKAAPSPLSQSTSAVHLQPLTGPRKLSKRKTATIGAIFGRSSEDKRNAVSLPITPVDGPNTIQPNNVDPHGALVAHEQSASAVSSSSASIMTKNSKKEKRGSVLGRLAKKFSLLRKSGDDTESVAPKDDWHHVSPEDPKYNPTIQPNLTVAEPASIGDVHNDLSPPLNEPVPHVSQDADRSSSISLEVPFATGRLTVVNPDLPSNENTPIGPELPLPPENPTQPAEPQPSPMLNNAEALHENSIQPSPEPLSKSVLPALAYVAQYSQPAEPVIATAPPEQTSHGDIDVEESLPPTPPAKSRAPSPSLPPPVLSPEIILQDTSRNVQSPVSASHDSPTITARPGGVLPSSSGTPSQVLSRPDIPLALNDDSVLVPPRARFSYTDSFTDSPMSTSSLDVGPPTPHNPVVPIPTLPRSHLPHPLKNEISSPPVGTRQSTKKTETFKLVRGAPGRIIGSTDTIVAAGQQWEVVETSMSKGRKDEQKSGRRKSPETHHETGEERVNREQERQRVRESEKLVTSEARTKEHHRDKERRHELSHDDKERRREMSRDEREERRRQAERERERQKEHERERERLKQQKEWEKERERQRQKDFEREREKERQREKEKERERQKERERERQKERERERQKERERERQKEQERERERQKEQERERQKEQERERERQREQERERERQREQERERERQKEQERERQKEQERERERQRENERRQKEREKEREREKARQKEQEEREREQRHRERKERDRERRDQERRSRHSEEVQRHRTSSQSHVHHKHEARETSTSTMSTSEARHGHRSDEQEGHRIRWPERRDGELPPVPTQSTIRPPLHRNPSSTSTRPTSELPSTAELMALRAKEAYDMERLFKARSMYGQEPEEATPNSIPSNLSDMGSTAVPGTVYGSSHTAYVFNPSSQNLRHHSNAPLPHSRDAWHPDRPYSYLSDLGTIPSLDSPTNRPFTNPLPEPPRQSTYQPTPLALLESSSTQASDYWTNYTITTAH